MRLVDPVPALAGALAERGVEREPGRRAGGVPGRGRLLPACGTARAATPRAWRRCAQECTRVFLEAADADLDPASFVDAFMGAIVMEPEPGAIETLQVPARAGARARGRLQLGHRARGAPRAPRARVALLGDRDHRGGGSAEAGACRLPARARAARRRRRRVPCTSATSPGTRRAPQPPGCGSRRHRSRPRSRAGREPRRRPAPPHGLADPRLGARPPRLREPGGRPGSPTRTSPTGTRPPSPG